MEGIVTKPPTALCSLSNGMLHTALRGDRKIHN